MSDQQPITFEIVAADSAAKIYLIDSDFHLVKKGIGRETFTVPPGVYKIKNRSGRTTTERLIVVREGLSTVTLEPILTTCAMPLESSTRTHEYHMSAASGAAIAPNLSRGNGSNIIIVARQWTGKGPRTSLLSPPNPARGLTLLDTTGTIVADVAALTNVAGLLDPIVTLNVEVAPGSYRLVLTRADGRRIAQTLIASLGWQTHVYLLVDGTVENDAARVDLINGAITLRKPSEGFKPDDPTLRAEEIAREALRDSHKILSDAVRAQFISAAASPLLALIGAHLLICEANDEQERLAREPAGKSTVIDGNRAELRTIVENLRTTVGKHPDVEAIAAVAGNPDPDYIFDVPPMLRASWPLILDVSVNRPLAIPPDSTTSHAAERIWGEGTWLQWLDGGPNDRVDYAALWQAKARQLIRAIDAPTHVSSARASELALPSILNELEKGVVTTQSIRTLTVGVTSWIARQLFATRTRTPFPDLTEVTPAPTESRPITDIRQTSGQLTAEQRGQLARQVGVPLSKLNVWMEQGDTMTRH